ncbi:hypothetical protein CY34DRAFT_805706, partial [Suillus luteus UH-Slu-Lm8-n1]
MSITIWEVVNEGSHPMRTRLTEGQLEKAANNFRRSKHTSSTISSMPTAKSMRFEKISTTLDQPRCRQRPLCL